MEHDLHAIARQMVASPKGILAADESNGSMNKRLAALQLPQDEETRRRYRELLITTLGIEEYVSGVILYDETIRQSTEAQTPFVDILKNKGILPGIKVDEGLIDDPAAPGEKLTEGLEGLTGRLPEYIEMGARFTKWRAVITIDGDTLPTEENIRRTGEILAQYAKVVQQAGMVPMIEPEVLKKGSHTIDRAEEVTKQTLEIVFDEIQKSGVDLGGLILKTSMVVTGSESGEKIEAAEVADRTVSVLNATVPKEVAGVVFLSGGQEPLEATANLQAIAEKGPHPWGVTFSFSRAVQEPVLTTWRNDSENVDNAQRIFLHRLKMNSLARDGKYSTNLEHDK